MTDLVLLTASYHAIRDGGPDGCVPVRSSIGAPRFLPESRTWAFASKTAPYKVIKIEDRGEFETAYIERLDGIGLDVVRAQLEDIAEAAGNERLVLCCFEKIEDIAAGKNWCHRHMFAAWWLAQTGATVAELRFTGRLPAVAPPRPRRSPLTQLGLFMRARRA
jgi:hypothetical protein